MLFQFFNGSIPPEFFQRIEFSGRFVENMHDDIDIIEQNPFAAPYALTMPGLDTLGEQTLIDRIRNGLNVNVNIPADYHKIVANRGEVL